MDQRVLLSPDGGTTNQSSTNTAFIVYTADDANDVAYATTYSRAGSGSGYLYKISNVFNGSAPQRSFGASPSAQFRQLRYTIRYRIRSFSRIAAAVSIM